MNIYIIATIFCSFLFSVGAILCKYGMKSLNYETHPNFFQLTWFLLRNKIWFLGVLISLGSNAAVLQIQSILDLSVIHSILTSTYVFTLLLGYFILGEKLNNSQWAGTVIVLLGLAIIILVGQPITGGATNINSLMYLSGISVILMITLIFAANFCESINYEIPYAISAGIAFGNCQVYVKASTNMIQDQLGSFSILSEQSILSFISNWPAIALFVFSISGFLCMHLSFSRGQISICVALLVVISRTISTFSGYFIYNEYFPPLKIIGLFIVILGIFAISFSSIKNEKICMSSVH